MKYKTGEEFLNKLYTDMYKSNEVMHTKEKQDTKEEAIHKYLDRLEHVHDIALKSEHNLDLLKEFYYQKYIIKELPESYIEHQKKMARERGYGDVYIDDEMIEEMLNSVKEDQKKSLDTWIEYFISNDSIYPMWFKNYAFQGMISLGIFDKEKSVFTKRTDKTTAPFIELNREVLSLVYDTIKSEIGENEVTEEYEKALKNGESFKKLYTYYLTKQNYKTKNEETDGIWIKYEQDSDYHILCDTLKGKNTGWCIAGEEVAKDYLEAGDFYIYYTKGDTLKYTEPRIAIRMEDDSIAEVRGVGPDQNIESNMIKIADQKLDEFPDKEEYKKKVHDMEMLTKIENKVNNNEQLTKEELIFLYEIEDKITGFGYQKDPRIDEIRIFRDIKKDLAYIYDIELENIGTCIEDFENNDIYVYCGDLHSVDYIKIDKNKLKKLKIFIGILWLNHFGSAEDLVLPKKINGSLYLDDLKSAEGLKLPEVINGRLNLNHLESAEGLVFPKKINGNLNLSRLESANNLILPEKLNGDLDLYSLVEINNLVFPKELNGDLNLCKLQSAKDLVLPEKVNGDVDLKKLKSAENLVLPKIINGNLNLRSLLFAKEIMFPEKLNGELWLDSLKSTEYALVLPKELNGGLNLSNLTIAEGIVFPQKINGHLNLCRLESAEGLVLPEIINDDLYLESLKSSKGLKLPKIINGNLNLHHLERAEGLILPEIMNGDINLRSLKSAKEVIFPKKTSGIIWLKNMLKPKYLIIHESLYDKIACNNVGSKSTITVLSDEEYSEYYDEMKNKQESEKVR